MVTIRNINLEWTTPGHSPKTSVMYYITTLSPSSQRSFIEDWLTSLSPWLSDLTSVSIATEGREIDAETGGLVGTWTDTTPLVVTGDGGNSILPDASQVLIRWSTGEIHNGRYLRGRTFIPGLAAANSTAGNVAGGAREAMELASNTFLGESPGMVIWARPGTAPGSTGVAISADVWAELAVLRRRRG